MEKALLFLHLVASIGMGFYLLLPFLVGRLAGPAAGSQAGYAGLLATANRIGMYLLIVQLLTGGYLLQTADYSVLWMVLIVLVFLAVAAFTGMLVKPLKRYREAVQQGKSGASEYGKIRLFSTLAGACFLLIIFLMKFPELFI
ncbi:hypothetical protein [Paenibacillus sp. YN15]|uniref:hypothetical protein n=1 Tax=Paenibacillus sp. YN15 TaxID=1742774 RepID=UPI000DCEC5C2|nr:hypothetical protein [Paenibacillus sp. YN15]RAV06579.1 hypothetical protein DQG13_01730 [Paenibacillus sp. YN15]